MNIRLILGATALTLALPVMASASTVVSGTNSSVSVTNTQGCLSTWSNSSDNYQTNSLSINGSGQLVQSVAIDGSLGYNKAQGAGNSVIQGDASLAITETHETGHDSSGSNFNGSESQSTVTTGSSAYSSFEGQ